MDAGRRVAHRAGRPSPPTGRAPRPPSAPLYAAQQAEPAIQWVPSPAAGLVVACVRRAARTWIRRHLHPRRHRQRRRPGLQRARRAVRSRAGLARRLEQRLEREARRPAGAARAASTRSARRPVGSRIRAARDRVLPSAADVDGGDRSDVGGDRSEARSVDVAARRPRRRWPRSSACSGRPRPRACSSATIQRRGRHDRCVRRPRRTRGRRCSPASSTSGTPRARGDPGRVRRPPVAPAATGATAREASRRPARASPARPGPWWALDGLAIVSERPLVAPPRRPRPAPLRGRAGARLGRRHSSLCLARRRGRADVIIRARADHRRRRSTASGTPSGAACSSSGSARSASSARAARELVHEDETGRLWRRDRSGRSAVVARARSRSSWSRS